MKELTLKTKIIVTVIFSVILLLLIYGYNLIVSTHNNIENVDLFTDNELIVDNKQKMDEKVVEKNEKKIIIHITGEIKKRGIITLAEGSRIADAIKEAGGTTNEANLDEINLAYRLEDGMKIYIPNKKEKMENKKYITKESGDNISINSKDKKGENVKVNINEASKKDLEVLPGIGEEMAKRIIEYRNANGKFNKIEDLQNVKGIGDSKFENLKNHITI